MCRDRACTVVVNAATVTGSAWQPTTPLPQGLYYWRLFGVRNAVAVTSASVAWNFRVGGGPSSVTGAALGTLDINGDGYAEVLVGAFRTSPGGRPEAGAVHVYAGSNVGIPATESLLLEGEVARDLFGVTVGSAGDINGDGYVDVLVGASGADPGGRRDAGRVYVYLGSAAGLVTPAHRVLDGEAVDDLLGSVVATAGDVNGDGYADTILGANQASPGGRAQAGAAYVYLGGSEGLSRAAPLVLAGMAAGDHFGSATAGAGDVNGDGYADVVVGAYRASPGGRTEAGAAYVYLGGNEGLSTTPHRVLGGTAPYDSAGVSVAGAGDVNGDGYADVIVGATGADPGGRILAGAAYVYLGSSAGLSATPRVLEGAAIGDAFGNSVACAGDLNGDGYADVIVGAFSADPGMRSYAGAVHVYLGGSSGLPPLANYVLEGGAPNDLFGAVVSGGGDVNGDGYADLRVGAYSASPGGRPIAGSAFVYLGGSGRPPLHRVLEGRVTGDVFGCSVANAGEVRRVHRRGA